MIAVIITAIPGIIAGLFNRWIFLASLFAIIPIIYLVNRFFVIIKWNLVEGIIEDVTLVNGFNQPYTEAHIIFKTKDNMEHECRFIIGHAWYNHIEDEREQDCGYTKEEFYNPRKCTSFQYQIPTYTSDIEFALEYIKNVIDKNIPLIREWINNVQTVDDAITVLNQRIVTLPHIYVPYMCHIRAFLYAKNNDIDNAIESIKQGYENSEIPQVIIDKLVQIANG